MRQRGIIIIYPIHIIIITESAVHRVTKFNMVLDSFVVNIDVKLYGVPFVSKLKMMLVFTIHAGISVKTKDVLVFTVHAGIYDPCQLVFTLHAGIYDPCWYLRFMLVFTIHAGFYGVRFVSKLKMMLVFTIHAGIYISCWYFLHEM